MQKKPTHTQILQQSESVVKLEIGGGRNPRAGYVSCDIRDLPQTDYQCNADDLPFEDGAVDEIYSRHVVEHFTIKEFLHVLKEWNRVLKKDGTLYIVCPNLLWHLRQILEGSHESFHTKERGKNDRYWGMGSLFGWQQDEYDIHKFGYYFELLRDILLDVGFDDIIDYTNTPNSLEHASWHLEVQAKKVDEYEGAPEESKFYYHFDVKH